ncbi:MAG: hypothetical protein QOF87_527 [Pseudonocardiales bacterium]|jgi:hypothetical protein|nr:hypothetical protein [Pseudonocardiales bacterium]
MDVPRELDSSRGTVVDQRGALVNQLDQDARIPQV